MNSQMWAMKVKSMCANQNRVVISTNWNQNGGQIKSWKMHIHMICHDLDLPKELSFFSLYYIMLMVKGTPSKWQNF